MIAAQRTGNGAPLVLVHGAGNDHTGFALVAPRLERHFRVIAIDRRGRGGSGDEPEYTLEREVEDVARAVRDAGEDAVLMGHSYGALVALEAARLVRGLPRLALYEPPSGGRLAQPGLIDELERLRARGDHEALLMLFLREISGMSDAEIEALRGTASWRARLGAAPAIPRELRAEADWRFDPARYAGLELPVLMLVGEVSPDWALRSTEEVSAALPNCEVRTLPGQGHAATLHAPELLASELSAFFS